VYVIMTNHVHLLVTPPHRWRLPSSCNLLDGTLCDTSMTAICAVCGAHIGLRQTRPEPRIRGATAHAQGLRERALFARFLSGGGRCRLCGWNRRDVTALRVRLPDRRCGGHRSEASESYLLARRDIEGGVGIRAGRQLLGMQRTRRSFADSGRRIAGARRGDDIPEILRALPRSGCRLTPHRRDPSVG
jgi:hypothetical protein